MRTLHEAMQNTHHTRMDITRENSYRIWRLALVRHTVRSGSLQ